MEPQNYLTVLRKNWIVVLILTFAGAGAGITYSLLATPVYTTSAKVFVSTSGASTAAELQQGSNFTLQRVKTYADLVTTAAVLQPTIDELEITTSVAKLRGHVSAAAPLNITVIDVTATDIDAEFSASLASAAAHQLIRLVERIETTNTVNVSPVRLTVVQEAEVPTVPTSPNRELNVALGILVGLALGWAVASTRAALDTKVRSKRDLELITNAPLLGGIVFDPAASGRPLIVHEDSQSRRAESFRALRTNLQFLDAGHEHHSFVITSAIPNEGKSTTATNLAIALSHTGARVLLVGADLRKPDLAAYMNAEGGVGLTDVLIGRVDLDVAIQPWGEAGLYLLPAGPVPPNPSELLGSEPMIKLISDLNEKFDVVLYDSPPLLPVTDAAVLSRQVGGAILVVAAGRTHAGQVSSALETLENVGAPVSGLVLTMLPPKGPDSYGHGRYGYGYGYGKNVELAPDQQ